MKKLFSVLVVGLLLMVYACGGGGDDPKSVMNDMFDAFEDLINDMDKATSADDVVAALEKNVNAMKKLAPRMKAVQEKHPELKGMKPGAQLPEEFKEIQKRMEELGPKMGAVAMKMMQFAKDPKVMEASKKWEEAMKAMQ
jgi:hypothetical protein